MKVGFNPDTQRAEEIKQLVKDNDGYCPCRIYKNEDTKCMCKEFRDQIKDESFEGLCHCGLYYKYK
jgi:ferredoxin-thioredoxin reductase catalytic subunit